MNSPKLKKAWVMIKVMFHAGRDAGESTSCPRPLCILSSSPLQAFSTNKTTQPHLKHSQEPKSLDGATKQGSDTVLPNQYLHIMEWCCGRGELIKFIREWWYDFLMEPVKIPGFPLFVPAHLMVGEDEIKMNQISKNGHTKTHLRVSQQNVCFITGDWDW